MENRFEKYLLFNTENGKIVSTNKRTLKNTEEALELF